MNNTTQTIRVGLFFILGVALIWSLYDTLSGNNEWIRNGDVLKAQFEDLQQLHIGDEVRMAGIHIGSVHSASLAGNKAVLELYIKQGFSIPSDSVATLTTAGLLGNNFISIDPGQSNTSLTNGDTIKTKHSADINAIIASFSDISGKLDGMLGGTSDSEGLFSNLDKLIVANREKISHVITNLEAISKKVEGSNGTLGMLVNDPDLYRELLAAAKDVQSFANNANKLMTSDQGVLGVLLNDPKAAAEIRATISNIASFSEKLNSSNSTLGQLVSSDNLYVKAEALLEKADHAINSIGDSGPMSAVGVAATALF
jgi:phospholipid/cholesterol/gamma-HCH transport system substrate-binding protein